MFFFFVVVVVVFFWLLVFIIYFFIYRIFAEYTAVDGLSWISHWLLTYPSLAQKNAFHNFP